MLTDARLNELRRTGDALADDCVRSLFASGEVKSVNAVLDALKRNDSPTLAGAPPALAHYLAESSKLPADFDADRFQRAQAAFELHGAAMGVSLMYASLPSLYAGAMGGVQLLTMTGQLANHYRRRAAETLRFILDCMEVGGFTPQGAGIRAIQKVRLIHATIRFFARHGGNWKALPEWGEPLNQEELGGTLLAFSVVAIDNCRRLGAPLSDEQAADLLYAWRVIGEKLGIVSELRPQTLPSARALWKRIGKRNFRYTEAGQKLAADHLAFLDELVPGKRLDGANLAISRWLMGRYVAVTCLRVPTPPLWTRALNLLRPVILVVDTFADAASPTRYVTRSINTRLMESLEQWWSDGTSPQFRIPTAIGPQGTS